MKHLLNISSIVILLAFVRFSNVSSWVEEFKETCIAEEVKVHELVQKFKETCKAEEAKVHELVEVVKSDIKNSPIFQKIFQEIERELLYVEPTVRKLIRKADKFFKNEVVKDLIDLALAIAGLNPAIGIAIETIQAIVVIIKSAANGKRLGMSKIRRLGNHFYDIAKASVTTFPNKVVESLERDKDQIKKIVRIHQSEGNGAIAKELLKQFVVVWVESEVGKVIHLADKFFSNPVVEHVEELILAVAGLKKANEVVIETIEIASAVLESIKEDFKIGRMPDLTELKQKIREIARSNAQVYESDPASHPWEKTEGKFGRGEEENIVLVDIEESKDWGPICQTLLKKMEAKVISVEQEVKQLITKAEQFLQNPIVKNTFDLALHIAQMNPYVKISVVSFKLVEAMVEEMKQVRKLSESERPQLNEKLVDTHKRVIEATSCLAVVKIFKDRRCQSSSPYGSGRRLSPYKALPQDIPVF